MYVLDTNVVSELRKIRLGKADSQVAAWADSIEVMDLFLSDLRVKPRHSGRGCKRGRQSLPFFGL